ncbi:hypothetical protein [Desulfonatronovibrio magnus]|uniref:hypothetical protein n=1 Tax=Desulfonatronovibrio magnus TaxID=698827 RepID=UPI0005EBCDD3|nr:hypothetical protein [Desulfonatronovibrio magnus]
MRILFTIPHFFDSEAKIAKGAKHGSQKEKAEKRLRGLVRQVLSLHQIFGHSVCMLHIASRTAIPAGQAMQCNIHAAMLTTGKKHLLHRLPLCKTLYEHIETDADPLFLGYECHRLMQERLGQYDYYCYLEDDLIINDPLFFAKLHWFTKNTGNICVLLPHRYENTARGPYSKVYIDGDLRPDITSEYQNVRQQPAIKAEIMGMPLIFSRTLNPHSGCFFLNQAQMEHFAARPWFMDRSARFIGPLESAASLGIMRTFKVYKPAREYAQFLEIMHAGTAFAGLIGGKIRIAQKQDS